MHNDTIKGLASVSRARSFRAPAALAPAAMIAILAIFGSSLVAGCGGKCENVISAQRLIRDQHRKASDGLPHAQLRLPHHRLNLLFHEALKAQPISVSVPLGSIPVPPVSVSAKRIEVTEAGRGRIGFDIELEIEIATISLAKFGATIDAKVRTVSSKDGTALEIGFDGDSLRQFRPNIPNAVVSSAGTALSSAVKQVSGTELPGPIADALASRIINQVTTSAFDVIRDQVLARLGELTKLRIELGNVPIERALARTDTRAAKTLVIDLWSTLAVANGLHPSNLGAEPISGTGELRIAGQALAELGNWAIAEKLAPQLYNSDLKPDPDGATSLSIGGEASPGHLKIRLSFTSFESSRRAQRSR